MSDFSVGSTFSSYKELEEKLQAFQDRNFFQLWRRDTRTIASAQRQSGAARKHTYNLEILYAEINYCFKHGGRIFTSAGISIRKDANSQVWVQLQTTGDGQQLQVLEHNATHDHDISEALYKHYPSLTDSDIKTTYFH